MNSKTAIALAIVAALATAPAYAGPKPVLGKYKCKGTVTKYDTLGSYSSGSKLYTIKAKLAVKRTAFLLGVMTDGSKAMIYGQFPPYYSATFTPQFSYLNEGFKALTSRCAVSGLSTRGTGSQNINGRKVELDISQVFSCVGSSTVNHEHYRLSCKR